MVQHLLIADIGAAAAARRHAQPGARLPAPARGPGRRWRARACDGVFRTLRRPLVAIPRLRARALRLALRRSSSRPPSSSRSSTPSSTRPSSGSECSSGGRRSSPSAAASRGDAVEDRPHPRRPPARDDARHGLRPHPRRRSTPTSTATASAALGPVGAVRPAARRRHDGQPRHPHHGLRACVLLLRRQAGRPGRGGRSRARRSTRR